MVGIKVCPKCGSEDVVPVGSGSHTMMCQECGYTGSSFSERNHIGGDIDDDEEVRDVHDIGDVDDYDEYEESDGEIVHAHVKKSKAKAGKSVKKTAKKAKKPAKKTGRKK